MFESVVEMVVLCFDGMVFDIFGYDVWSGIFLCVCDVGLLVFEYLIVDDVKVVFVLFEDVVCDVFWVCFVYCLMWLVLVFMLFVCAVFQGFVFLFFFEVLVVGVGKGLLFDCVVWIVMGCLVFFEFYMIDNDELKK